MAALHPLATAEAAANVHVELSIDRATWNVHLVLLIHARGFDALTAIRTTRRQARLVDLIDLIGRR